MKINQLKMTGFKAHDREIKLDKLNLIFGPNGSGKTAILDAITFAVTGNTKLGATLEATQQLASRSGCVVTASIDPDIEIDRAIYKDAASKTMKMNLTIKGREQLKLKKAEEWVSEQLGNFAPTFDINAFLGLSADKRRDFVLQLCSAGEKCDAASLIHKFFMEYCAISLGRGTLAAYSESYDANFPEATLAQKKEYLLTKLADAERVAMIDLLTIIGPFIKGDISNAITSVLDAAKIQTNGAKQAKDSNDQAVRSISERKEAIKIVSESADQLKKRKKDLNDRKEDRIANFNERKGMQTAIEDRKNQIEDLKTKIERIVVEIKDHPILNESEHQDKINELLVEIAKLEAEVEPAVNSLHMLETQVTNRKQLYDDASESVIRLGQACNSMANAVVTLTRKLDQCTDDDWNKLAIAIVDLEENLVLDAKQSTVWRTITDIVVKHGTEKEIMAIQAQLQQSKEKRLELDAELKSAENDTQKLKTAWLEIQTEHRTAEEELRRQQDQYHRNQGELTRMNGLLAEMYSKLKDHKEFYETRQKASDEHYRDIAVHQKCLEELLQKCDAFNIGKLESEIEGLKNSMAEIDARLEDIGKYDQLTQSYQECIQKAEHENTRHEVGKKLCAAIRAVREDIMDSLTLPLKARMTDFLAIAAPECRPFIDLETDRGKAIFQLGWIYNDERRVPLPAMSGGESTVFCAALAYAMVDLANPPLKLLMLEVGECDDKTFYGLIEAIEGVCREKTIQAIVATHYDRVITDDPWNIIYLQPSDRFGRGTQKDHGFFVA